MALTSSVEIVNVALAKLGEQAILAFNDDSVPGRLAQRDYDHYRDALLSEYPWNFAIKRAELAIELPAPTYEFANKYRMPVDLLRLIEVDNPHNWPWRREGDHVLTDMAAPLRIKYVARNTNPAEYPSYFAEALAGRLAMEWAEGLTGTRTVVEQMASLYRNKLQVARVADGQEDSPRQLVTSTFIDVRF